MSMDTQRVHQCIELFIVGKDGAAVAVASQRFCRKKGCRRHVAERTTLFAIQRAAKRLRIVR